MDTTWLTAIVGILGIGSTLTLALVNRRDSAKLLKLQFEREDAKEAAERVRARRALERDSVIKLSGIFAAARRLADRDPDDDPPGQEWDEDFPESWEPTYYAAMQESGLVSDQIFRDVLQECTQAIYWCSGLRQIAGAGSGRRIARESASLGFVVAGSWLRDEPIGSDSDLRIKKLRTLLKDYDEMWEARQLRSPGEEPD